MRYLIGRYHEIALKGRNQWRFVDQLKQNLRAIFADYRLGLGKGLIDEAYYLWAKGDKDAALETLQQATKELRALSAAFADQPQFAIALARAYSDQGQMLGGLRKTDQEEEAYRQCLEVLKQVRERHSWDAVGARVEAVYREVLQRG